MQLTPKDLGAMKMPLLALAIAVAASFAMVAFSSNQLSQSEKQHRDQLTALQEARTRYQRSGDERETVMHFVKAYRQRAGRSVWRGLPVDRAGALPLCRPGQSRRCPGQAIANEAFFRRSARRRPDAIVPSTFRAANRPFYAE